MGITLKKIPSEWNKQQENCKQYIIFPFITKQ